MSYQDDLAFAVNAVKSAFHETIQKLDMDVYSKSSYDEVTNIDYNIEKTIIELIKSEYGDKILSEELNPDSLLQDRTWIIDPIDGTCNMTHGIKTFGVQMALYDKGKVALSVIYLPHDNETYTAIRGEGAYLNGNKITHANRPVEKSIISLGDFVHTSAEKIELEQRIIKHIAPRVERIRMFGAACVDYAYSANGIIDGNFTFVDNLWDIAPGLLLCEEAGMIITDLYGRPYNDRSKAVAVFSTQELKEKCVLPIV